MSLYLLVRRKANASASAVTIIVTANAFPPMCSDYTPPLRLLQARTHRPRLCFLMAKPHQQKSRAKSSARCLPVQGAFCHFVKSVQKISAFANLILLLPDIFI